MTISSKLLTMLMVVSVMSGSVSFAQMSEQHLNKKLTRAAQAIKDDLFWARAPTIRRATMAEWMNAPERNRIATAGHFVMLSERDFFSPYLKTQPNAVVLIVRMYADEMNTCMAEIGFSIGRHTQASEAYSACHSLVILPARPQLKNKLDKLIASPTADQPVDVLAKFINRSEPRIVADNRIKRAPSTRSVTQVDDIVVSQKLRSHCEKIYREEIQAIPKELSLPKLASWQRRVDEQYRGCIREN